MCGNFDVLVGWSSLLPLFAPSLLFSGFEYWMAYADDVSKDLFVLALNSG